MTTGTRTWRQDRKTGKLVEVNSNSIPGTRHGTEMDREFYRLARKQDGVRKKKRLDKQRSGFK